MLCKVVTSIKGGPRDTHLSEVIFVVADSSGTQDTGNTKCCQHEWSGVSRMTPLATTIGDLLARQKVAKALAQHIENWTVFFGAKVKRTYEIYEYPCRLNEHPGAAVDVAPEAELTSGIHEWLQLTCWVTKGELCAMGMLLCVRPAVQWPNIIHLQWWNPFRLPWPTQIEQIRSYTTAQCARECRR